MRIRAKICGLTRPADARLAAEAGADAVGLIFAESPRQVARGQAAAIVRALPPWVTAVGVFVDALAEAVLETVAAVGLTAVQLHGDEPPETVAALTDANLKTIKAFGVAEEADLATAREWARRAGVLDARPDAYLVDARVPGGPKGGTGRTADWGLARRLAEEGLRPLILAGGLGPDNVVDAIRAAAPWGVDGSSRLETAPGEKDAAAVRAFLEAVRGAAATDT